LQIHSSSGNSNNNQHSYKYQLHTAALPATKNKNHIKTSEFCQVFLLSLIANLNNSNNCVTPSHKEEGQIKEREGHVQG